MRRRPAFSVGHVRPPLRPSMPTSSPMGPRSFHGCVACLGGG